MILAAAVVARPTTLSGVLTERATRQPEKLSFTFLDEGGNDVALTYAELDRRARAIAALLQQSGLVGERVLVLCPPGPEYVTAIMGCLHAGAVAVPAYPPRPNRGLARIEAIVRDADARMALTTAATLAGLRSTMWTAPHLAALRWEAVDRLACGLEELWRGPSVKGSDIGLLQYTSGSTGVPRGVMVSLANLWHNSVEIARVFRLGPASSGVTWLPPYHDMGLIAGVLQPLFSGFPAYVLPPVAFLQRPLRWLEAISRYGASISGAPDFAYDLCARRISPDDRDRLDLSSWEVAFIGGERVRPETLDRFAETFASCGFRREAFSPNYGLAEATLFVSGGRTDRAPRVVTLRRDALTEHRVEPCVAGDDGQSFVGCGPTSADTQLVIVDPTTGTRCASEQVGEIWLKNDSVAQGYWRHPSTSEEAFRAHVGPGGEGPFLRTGDLGFIADGELFVTGRLKELIVVRGRNYYPQDIEGAAERSHPALRPATSAAFAIDLDGAERLVLVHEVDRSDGADPEPLFATTRRAVAESFDLEVHSIVLVRKGGVPRTSSGKIQRGACRDAFLSGTLPTIAEWRARTESSPAILSTSIDNPRDRDQVEMWLRTRLAAELELTADDIESNRPFASFGLDSVKSVQLAAELSIVLGVSLSPTLTWDYPTVSALARHLAGEALG
jgi:acyl-CoA synthetase (AMP-forming)/AMP-acid ligase II/acyl carrier protein